MQNAECRMENGEREPCVSHESCESLSESAPVSFYILNSAFCILHSSLDLRTHTMTWPHARGPSGNPKSALTYSPHSGARSIETASNGGALTRACPVCSSRRTSRPSRHP